MDSIKEKDVSIEVRNASFPNDSKANEVSLAEVENDEGYQYIQLKNSETLNNTKGLETENQNDGILFKQLNDTENTTTKGVEETEEDPESINNVNDSELTDENSNENNDNYDQNNNDNNENNQNIKIKINKKKIKNKSKKNFGEFNDEENPDHNYNYINKKPNSSRNKNINYINNDDINNYNKENDYQNINVNNYLRDNSDRLNDQSEREFFEKVIVRNEEPYEEHTSETYSITICPKVTTVKFEGETFSYLTNPTNDENFFFLKLNKNSHNFELCDLEEYKRNHLDTTRIPFNQLLGFVTEMNMGLQGLHKEVRSKRLSIRLWSFVKIFAIFAVLAAAAYLLYFHGEKFFGISANSNRNIFYGFCALCVIFICFIIYLFSQDLTASYEICKIHLERQQELEEIVEKWNQEYFVSNLNMNCSIPYTFPYIQITLQPNLLIYLEEHEIFE